MQQAIIMIVVCIVALVVGGVISGILSYRKGFRAGDAGLKAREDGIRRDAEADAKAIREAAEKEKKKASHLLHNAEEKLEEAKHEREDAAREAELQKKNALVEAKEEIHQQRNELEKEMKERRAEISRSERRVQQKEENLDRKTENLDKRDESLKQKLQNVEDRLTEIDALKNAEQQELERISGLTREQAKDQILTALDRELTHEKALKINRYEQDLADTCEETARKYVSLAVSKCAVDQASEAAVSVVTLPNDEMKGRIIGREGRNVKTLETLTGVDFIIDDTPEAITLSCFDPMRREIARIALEKLISDGRIHPTKIEEAVEKATYEVEHCIMEEAERAMLETNVHGLNRELMKLLGRLHYRTSYRQNVLAHSIEVAKLSGVLASEIGVDANLARRAGLLHDIGKALTAEIEGSHVQIGVDVCRKYHESEEVIHAVEAHHGDVEPRTAIACIVQAADAISASRPGARNENYENYIQRLQNLENICTSYEGVEKCYALQAGREVRVMVKPDEISDDEMTLLAQNIANKIETELDYPGQIKVNLIRESRAVTFAK